VGKGAPSRKQGPPRWAGAPETVRGCGLSRVAWFVYMVQCRDASLYTGATNDLSRRVKAHSEGKGARYTRSRRPVTLVFSRRVKDRSSALKLEAKLKRLSRAEKVALVASARRRRMHED